MTRHETIIVLLMTALALGLSCAKKEVVEEYKARWIRLRHTPLDEATVGGDASVEAEVVVSQGVSDVKLFLYYGTEGGPYEVVEMKPFEEGRYFGSIPSQGRGTLVHYYIEASAGADLIVKVPSDEKVPAFEFPYKGVPSRKLLLSHMVLMFAALFIFLLSGYLAFRAIKDRRLVLHIPRLSFLGAVLFFVSSFPLGMVVAYQTYGKPWTGFPVGDDITDNKSLAIVVYWAVAAFLYRGSVFKKDPNKDLLSMRTLPYVYLLGVLVTVALFLIPH